MQHPPTGNAGLAPLQCPRCQRGFPSRVKKHLGCPTCAAEGVAVNLVAAFVPPVADYEWSVHSPGEGIWRFSSLLPVNARQPVSLGEGDTPLVDVPTIGGHYDLKNLKLKNETTNPTWSHKDRLCAMTVTAAMEQGATVVTAASTGNHGAALAAYAARAGLRCVIFTLESVPATMKTLMQMYGAAVIAVKTSSDRYTLMKECVNRYDWYPASNSTAPPVGSDPYGVDGYKTIAYELYEEYGQSLPEWIVVPVAYGDCLSGIARGLHDLQQAGLVESIPRLIAAERFGAIGKALVEGFPADPVEMEPTAAFSIGGAYATWQAVEAIKDSQGVAVSVSEADLLAAQTELASMEGLFAEASSCAALAAVRTLRHDGTLGPGDRVAAILTSSGLKDPEGAGKRLLPVPTVEPDLESLKAAFVQDYGAEIFTPVSKEAE